MGSTLDRKPIAPPNDRRVRDVLVMVGIGVILLFAIVGVVSAGIFAGSKLTGASPSPPTPRAVTGSSAARQDVARARAQATQIVAAAQQSGKAVVKRETTRARRQAAAIIAAARRQAAAIPAPTASSGTSGSTTSQQASGTGTGGTTSTGTTSAAGNNSASGTPPSATANLSGLPSSWLVVAYNATFGSGPGSAGSITVTNRSGKRFSGTAEVVYAGGGTARAVFSGLAPGQTLVLPLNGPTYPGRGFTIRVVNPH